MCGIAGFIHFDLNQPACTETVQRMTDIIAHRGPDDKGAYVDSNIALGHRRLAIIDLNSGHQPMANSDASLVIVFNGEIYNYVELREELRKKKHHFSTDSDTEVILAAYQEWGTDCVEKFNGMWAFALWDKAKKRLFCSRDRVGEKPFYYTIHKNTFAFGSEIKSLFAYGVPRQIDWEMLDVYLCFTYVPAPHSFFKNIYKLRAGHSLIVENEQVREVQYWDVSIPPEEEMREDEPNILREFEEIFYDAVKIRMRSDVPFGAFLSGGLDSSAVVSVMADISTQPVKTSTIGYEDNEFDERELARLVANKFQTDHVERTAELKDAELLMQKLAWHYDEPFGDSSALPTYIVSKITRDNVKMVLTGDGGDEVLSGYTIHQGEKFSQQFTRVPSLLRLHLIPLGLNVLHTISNSQLRRKVQRAKRVIHSANLDFTGRLEAKCKGFSRFERSNLIVNKNQTVSARELIEDVIRPVSNRDNFTKLNYWLLKVSLPDDMLCKVDRASMANGLEARIPFLDHRIIELLATVSMKVKLRGYTRKYILRETLGKRLPIELLSARKRGFGAPLHQWFKNAQRTFLETRALQSTNSGMIRKKAIKQFLLSHSTEKNDYGSALWSLGMLSFVLENGKSE